MFPGACQWQHLEALPRLRQVTIPDSNLGKDTPTPPELQPLAERGVGVAWQPY